MLSCVSSHYYLDAPYLGKHLYQLQNKSEWLKDISASTEKMHYFSSTFFRLLSINKKLLTARFDYEWSDVELSVVDITREFYNHLPTHEMQIIFLICKRFPNRRIRRI